MRAGPNSAIILLFLIIVLIKTCNQGSKDSIIKPKQSYDAYNCLFVRIINLIWR